MDCYYPLRNQVSFELTMKDIKQLLSRGSSDTEKYTLQIESIRLRLVYAEFEQRIRERLVESFWREVGRGMW